MKGCQEVNLLFIYLLSCFSTELESLSVYTTLSGIEKKKLLFYFKCYAGGGYLYNKTSSLPTCTTLSAESCYLGVDWLPVSRSAYSILPLLLGSRSGKYLGYRLLVLVAMLLVFSTVIPDLELKLC